MGWTPDVVDKQLTLPLYNSLVRFWCKQPPTAVLLAHYVGYHKPEETGARTDAGQPASNDDEMSEDDMATLAQVFGFPPPRPKGEMK